MTTEPMTAPIRLYMSMSLDGFIAGPDDRAAAGDRGVMVHGAGAAQSLLQAGQLDELEIHLVPVLLGDGRRLFGTRDGNHIELELIRRLEGRDVTHLRYRVRH